MLPALASLADAATRLLPAEVADYYASGSGDETAVREAEAAWSAWRLRPRVLRDVTTVDVGVTLLGQRLATPVLVAPTAFHPLAHPEGEVATAIGTASAGSLMVVSTRAGRRIEDIAAACAPWWLQVYVMQDRRLTDRLVDRAVRAGATALVLTGDTPYVGQRARSDRPLTRLGEIAGANLAEHLAELGVAELWPAAEQDPGATTDDIRRLSERSGLPVLVKGVLRGDEALRCVAAGAAGVIVSNHGGRQLDRALATAFALPDVVAALEGQVPVLVDGGIRSGVDALVALALGADAVLLGRPVLWGLAVDGAAGVSSALTGVTEDLRAAMALAGARDLASVTADLVHRS